MNQILSFRLKIRGLSLLAGLLWVGLCHAQTGQLLTHNARLTIDRKGLLTIRPTNNQEITISTSVASLWALSLKNIPESNDLGAKVYETSPNPDVDIRQGDNEITLTYASLRAGNRDIPIKAQFKIYTKDEKFCFSASLSTSDPQWEFRELTYPILSSIKTKENRATVYWPNGLGQRFDDPASFGKKSFDYPSGRGTMQWFSINTAGEGLYVATHDASKTKKQFNAAYNSGQNDFTVSVSFPVYQQAVTTPEVVVKPYQGNWYAAADYYRNWYDTVFKMPSLPDWVQEDAGWMLAILKQQNGYVMWRYAELDTLCDLAESRGFKTIGLFGWANGGHDYLYPNYIPDDLLGGRQALKAAIERVHKRGFRIVLYANGTIIDAGTEYYRYNGNQTIALKEDKSAYTSSIRKYNSSSPVVFVEASYSSPLWRKTMLDLALQAHELGADGILYDQVGVKGALLNFSKIQEHTLPQESGTKYRYQMLSEIRSTLKKLNPDFVVMTEGVNDGILTDIDYYHGWGEGTSPGSQAFPALFKYTFPEFIMTQRHSSPMLPRYQANYALVTGQRHEIETRWEADVAYLRAGKQPNENSYHDEAYFPPNPKSINEVPAAVATQYIHDLVQFENQQAEFFRYGKFIDENGFAVSGQDIMAKGFQNDNRLGIVVWNMNRTQERSFDLKVPGYQLIEAKEPATATTQVGAPLNPNSIRLLIFKKDKNL